VGVLADPRVAVQPGAGEGVGCPEAGDGGGAAGGGITRDKKIKDLAYRGFRSSLLAKKIRILWDFPYS